MVSYGEFAVSSFSGMTHRKKRCFHGVSGCSILLGEFGDFYSTRSDICLICLSCKCVHRVSGNGVRESDSPHAPNSPRAQKRRNSDVFRGEFAKTQTHRNSPLNNLRAKSGKSGDFVYGANQKREGPNGGRKSPRARAHYKTGRLRNPFDSVRAVDASKQRNCPSNLLSHLTHRRRRREC